jgi:hypothetical protein
LEKLIADAPALKVKFVTVAQFHNVPPPVLVINIVPLPSFIVLVPVPVQLNEPAMVQLLLLTELSNTQPLVDAVHAPPVIELTDMFALIVMVHVTPPTHVFASRVTSSDDPGAEAPVVPPDVVDHIVVLELSHVHAAVHTANRATASACAHSAPIRMANARASLFMAIT